MTDKTRGGAGGPTPDARFAAARHTAVERVAAEAAALAPRAGGPAADVFVSHTLHGVGFLIKSLKRINTLRCFTVGKIVET